MRIYHVNLMKPYMERQCVVNLTVNMPDEMPLEVAELPENSEAYSVKEVMEKACRTKLSGKQAEDLSKIIQEYRELFGKKPGKTALIKHDIELTAETPVQAKAYRLSPSQRVIIEKEVQKMLDFGIIEPGESDFTSPIFLVEAPGKDPRPCIDYRKLNAITKDQPYPIPNIEERVERVSSARYISSLDLIRGYWQVPLTEKASRYAAFICHLVTFRPLMLPFGLKNAPFCFSRLMDSVLKGTEDYALPYLDDIAIFSDTWENHIIHLREVFARLKSAGLTVKAEKCQLGCAQIQYLGHVVGQGCRRPIDIKVAAVKEFRRPLTKSEVRMFLGLTSYYRQYIKDYSSIASPLTDSLRKEEPNEIRWDAEKERAFQALKAALISKPVLRAPDFAKPFFVQCDASDRGLGAILCQRDENGQEHPVLYASRKLTVREQAYSASEKECACLVWAARKFSCYLYGTRFTFQTDHCPLQWLQKMSPKNGSRLRWSLILQEFNFDVVYKRGKQHGNADCLSRYCCR